MPLVKINNLALAGLNHDISPATLPENFITYAKNIRVANGGLSSFGGHTNILDFPIGVEPYDLLFINSGTSKYWMIACSSKIYKYESALVEVTPDAMTNVDDGTKWSITNLSSIPIVNHPGTGPMYMFESDVKLKPLPFKSGQTWAQSGNTCNLMISHKQFLFAFGLSKSGKFSPDSFRWSAPADTGGIPPTWDELDTTNAAGLATLGGTGGEVISALPMRDSIVVYRSQGISVIDWVGGRYVWKIRHMNSSIGLLSKNSVVDVNGIHYFISDGDIYRNDGNTIRSIATNRIKQRLRAINKKHYKASYAVHNQNRNEILFCVPTSSSDYPNIAYIYNYEYDSWTNRDLPINRITRYGLKITDTSSWDTLNSTWDGFGSSWDDDATTPFDNSLLSLAKSASGTPAKIISIDSLLGFNIEPFDSIIERTDLNIGDVSQTKTIQRVYLRHQGASKIEVQIGSQMFPDGPVNWKPPVMFDSKHDRKVDIRSTGALFAYRISIKGVTGDFLLSGIDIEFTEAGKR